jgi:Zn finger protein HypA/HybF involved in hydrogenase expression
MQRQRQATEAEAAGECEALAVPGRRHPIGWARQPKRVFDIDMQHCPNCDAGKLKITAGLEQPVTERTLTGLGLEFRLPPIAPPREPGRHQAG